MKHLMFASIFILSACSASLKEVPEIQLVPVIVQGESCVPLIAGQHHNIGSVCATIEDEYMKVTYSLTGDWKLEETHLWVGTSLTDLPATPSGNPQIGLFPYASGPLDHVNEYSHYVPLSLFGLTADQEECNPLDLFLVAHAAVVRVVDGEIVQGETAFGEGPRLVRRGSWGMYFGWRLVCEQNGDPEPEPLICETAFARGESATCFSEFGFSRWGWTNGALKNGIHTMDIYAGAAQCDISKGLHVGTLHVSFNQGVAVVQYQMLPGFTMSETHLYVGEEPLPRDVNGDYTVAPGQYPVKENLYHAFFAEYEIGNLPPWIHVVAHSVVCQQPESIETH